MKVSLSCILAFIIIVILCNCSTTNVSTHARRTPIPEVPIDTPIEVARSVKSAREPIDVSSRYLSAPTDQPPKNIWSRLRRGFALPHEVERVRVAAELRWFKTHPGYVDRVAERASRHLYFILEELEARAMPTEIALLPIVESAYDPFAYSHGRAMGLWQFIPSTARLYKLQMDWWYDGRRDIVASTRAALSYLENLHRRFDGDWMLALAAYNSGEGNIRKAIRRNQLRGRPTDFWSLDLLAETNAYVPRLLAVSALIAEPSKYGITLRAIPDKPYWVQVEVGSQLDLGEGARMAEIETAELYRLNPAFNQWATHPRSPQTLLIPAEQEQTFRKNLSELPIHKRLGWERHKIKAGDTLGEIAMKYNTSVNVLRQFNRIKGSLIRAGQSLLIPVALRQQEDYSLSQQQRLKRAQARLYAKHNAAPLTHTVVSGDTLWDLSRKYNVNMRSLATWNGMASLDILKPGTVLKVWSKNRRDSVVRKVNYRVRKGESLSLIASKFNLSVNNIKKWNNKVSQKHYIHPGERLTLYVDVTQTE